MQEKRKQKHKPKGVRGKIAATVAPQPGSGSCNVTDFPAFTILMSHVGEGGVYLQQQRNVKYKKRRERNLKKKKKKIYLLQKEREKKKDKQTNRRQNGFGENSSFGASGRGTQSRIKVWGSGSWVPVSKV